MAGAMSGSVEPRNEEDPRIAGAFTGSTKPRNSKETSQKEPSKKSEPPPIKKN